MKSLLKMAGHVENRARERTDISHAEIAALRQHLQGLKLRPGKTYHHTWPGRGHAIIGSVGPKKRHVVKTILGPDMPPRMHSRPLPGMVTPKDIHRLADHVGVKWDNEPSFLALSKKVTGVSHLDHMNPTQLRAMRDELQKLGDRKLEPGSDAHIRNLAMGRGIGAGGLTFMAAAPVAGLVSGATGKKGLLAAPAVAGLATGEIARRRHLKRLRKYHNK